MVFPYCDGRVLVCDIEDRGWSIPSGRVEPHETSVEAVIREAQEEGGVLLCDLQYIGCYRISEKMEVRWADVYVARISEFGEIIMKEESLDRQLVTFEELPHIYHLWNPLTEMVFNHSLEIFQRFESQASST